MCCRERQRGLPGQVAQPFLRYQTNPTTPRTATNPPITGQDGNSVARETPDSSSRGNPQQTKWSALSATIVSPMGGLAPKSVVSDGSTSFRCAFTGAPSKIPPQNQRKKQPMESRLCSGAVQMHLGQLQLLLERVISAASTNNRVPKSYRHAMSPVETPEDKSHVGRKLCALAVRSAIRLSGGGVPGSGLFAAEKSYPRATRRPSTPNLNRATIRRGCLGVTLATPRRELARGQ